MKKTITSTLILFALLFSALQAQVIFDPGVYPPENLPDGMSIVDISGTKYLKVVLNSWSTAITLDEDVTIAPGHTRMRTMVKYATGTSGFTMDNVNTFLKLADAGWGDVVASGQGSSAELVEYIIDGVPEDSVVHAFQMAGQETTGWSAVTGDTLYIGRVVVEDPMALLDPVVVLPANLPDGWAIDNIDGTSYFKITLNGWNSSFQFNTSIGAISVPANVTAVKTMVKYEVGISGFTVDGINTFLKFADASWTEITAKGSGSSTEFMKYSLGITPEAELGVFQVAGQETTGWSAVVGDTMWVGAFYPDMVESITVSGAGDATSIDAPAGTLQMSAAVMPEDVYNDTVSWSVSDEGIATIDESGLLTAVEDGTVTVTATSADGSEVTGTLDITVTNQHEGVPAIENRMINIYPNPVKNTLYIENTEMVSNIAVFDMSGKLLINIPQPEMKMTVDVSNLKEGVYIVRASQKNKVQTIKLVK